MKRKFAKVLSILLVFALLLSMMPMTVLAADSAQDGAALRDEPAHVHNYRAAEWLWFENNTAIAVLVCDDCNDTQYVLTDNVTVLVAVEPTCTDPGISALYASVDYQGNTYTEYSEFTVDPLGHVCEAPDWEWYDGYESANAIFFCEVCGEEEIVPAIVNSNVLVSNHDHPGATMYVADAMWQGHVYHSFRIQYNAGEEHDFEEPEWEWDYSTHTATATFRCTECSKVVVLNADVDVDVDTDPTCEEDGSGTFTAYVDFNGDTYYSDPLVDTIPCLGHTYGEHYWEWEEDLSAATLTFFCDTCGHDETMDAYINETVLIPANAFTQGVVLYTATVRFEGEVYKSYKLSTIEEVDYEFGEPEWNWSEDGYSAQAVFQCLNADMEIVMEADISVEYDVFPSCEEAGSGTVTATVKFNGETYTDSQNREFDALGHIYYKPVWNWADDLSAATADFTCLACGHFETVEAEVTVQTLIPATYITPGLDLYTATATMDGVDYTARRTSIVDDLDYEFGEPEWVWSESGYSAQAVFQCLNADLQIVINADMDVEVEVEANCLESGSAYVTATVQFNGETYTDSQNVEIPAFGHLYDDPVWEWAEDYSAATATFNCIYDDDSQTVEAVITEKVLIPANYITIGLTLYTAAVYFEGQTYTSYRTAVVGELHHEFGEPEWIWDEDGCSAVAVFQCQECDLKFSVEADMEEEVLEPATCEEDGLSNFTATVQFNGQEYVDVNEEVVVNAYGHFYYGPEWAWSEDNSEATATFTCLFCDDVIEVEAEVETNVILEQNHEHAGLYVFTATAEFEEELYTARKVLLLAAQGHDFEEPEWIWDEDNCSVVAHFKCACDYEEYVEAEMIWNPIVEATCEEGGTYLVQGCVFYNDQLYFSEEKEVEIDALGHYYGAPADFFWTIGENYEYATVTFTCRECGEQVSFDAELVPYQIIPANHFHSGITIFVAKVEFEGRTYPYYVIHEEDMIEHTFTGPEWYWDEETYLSADAVFTCEECGLVLRLEAEISIEQVEGSNLSCTEPGDYRYTATVEFNGETYTDERLEHVEPYGHFYGDPEWTWSDDYTAATATFTCFFEDDVQTLDAEVRYYTIVNATYDHPGLAYAVAKVEFEEETYTARKLITVPALMHTYGEPEWLWDEDFCACYAVFTCEDCGEELYVEAEVEETILVLNTCTETGSSLFTASVFMDGELYTDEVEVETPAYGHFYARPVWDWAEDFSAATATFTCFFEDDEQVLEAEVTSYTLIRPTETRPGLNGYIARVEFEGETYKSVRLGTVEPLEHICPCAMFEDMPEYGTPEHEAIDWAYTEGITAGMDEAHFGTGETLTRAQAATFLYAAAGKPEFDENAAENNFSDVAAGKWYTKAVLRAASEGIFSGYSDGTFQPNTTLTRGQILVVLYAQAGKPSVEGLENPYSDVADGKWFTDAAIWAYYEGIEQGENGLYGQDTACTREAFVLYLYRTMTGNCLLGE